MSDGIELTNNGTTLRVVSNQSDDRGVQDLILQHFARRGISGHFQVTCTGKEQGSAKNNSLHVCAIRHYCIEIKVQTVRSKCFRYSVTIPDRHMSLHELAAKIKDEPKWTSEVHTISPQPTPTNGVTPPVVVISPSSPVLPPIPAPVVPSAEPAQPKVFVLNDFLQDTELVRVTAELLRTEIQKNGGFMTTSQVNKFLRDLLKCGPRSMIACVFRLLCGPKSPVRFMRTEQEGEAGYALYKPRTVTPISTIPPTTDESESLEELIDETSRQIQELLGKLKRRIKEEQEGSRSLAELGRKVRELTKS